MDVLDLDLRLLNVDKIIEESNLNEAEAAAYQIISSIMVLKGIQIDLRSPEYTVLGLLSDLSMTEVSLTAAIGMLDRDSVLRAREVYQKCYEAMVD